VQRQHLKAIVSLRSDTLRPVYTRGNIIIVSTSTANGYSSSLALTILHEAGLRLTYRQLDYWIRSGRFSARNADSGSGRPRTFTEAEVRVLAFMACLADAASLDVAATAGEQLLVHPELLNSPVLFVDRSGNVATGMSHRGTWTAITADQWRVDLDPSPRRAGHLPGVQAPGYRHDW
jgi:hypothetical protein